MDGSHNTPSDKRYVLLDNDLADIVENADPKVFRDMMKFLAIFNRCECGCRGRSHFDIREIAKG